MADEPQIHEQTLLDLLELVQAQQERADKILGAVQIQTHTIESQRRQVQGLLTEIPGLIQFTLDQQNELCVIKCNQWSMLVLAQSRWINWSS